MGISWTLLRRLAVGLFTGAIIALVVVYLWSESIIAREFTPEQREVTLAGDEAERLHGERMALLLGCFQGCHGRYMQGDVFIDSAAEGRVVAPNLTRGGGDTSLTEFEAMVRQGIGRGGRALLDMPSASFAMMSDRDLAALYAFIRSFPPQENDPGASHLGPMARLDLITGELPLQPALRQHSPWTRPGDDEPLRQGEYLALLACSECHGLDLQGQGPVTPSLDSVGAYDLEQFRRLMATGAGLDPDMPPGLMVGMAQWRFRHFTDAEVEALYRFLSSL
jgi:mono/diheme cytochrome c family protein